jgi:hypothetical protein
MLRDTMRDKVALRSGCLLAADSVICAPWGVAPVDPFRLGRVNDARTPQGQVRHRGRCPNGHMSPNTRYRRVSAYGCTAGETTAIAGTTRLPCRTASIAGRSWLANCVFITYPCAPERRASCTISVEDSMLAKIIFD